MKFKELLIPPMLASRIDKPFDDEDYIFEVKWDGYRCIAFLEADSRLQSRNLLDLTPRFPDLQELHRQVKVPLVLDGEIILLVDGVPSFQKLLARDRLKDPSKVRRAALQQPAIFVAFDLLYVGERNLMKLPLLERKELLSEHVRPGDNLIISQYIPREGKALYQACVEKQLEGVVAKKADSSYLPGKRTTNWLKIKKTVVEELFICGYTLGKGGRASFGALILGAYEGGQLIFRGQVGTGFSQQEIARLLKLFANLAAPQNPFGVNIADLSKPHWLEPRLVCQVEYLEKTTAGLIRHGSYRGLKPD